MINKRRNKLELIINYTEQVYSETIETNPKLCQTKSKEKTQKDTKNEGK